MKKKAGFSDPPVGAAAPPAARRPRKAAAKKRKSKGALPGLLANSQGGPVWNPAYTELARRLCAHLGATQEDLAKVIGVYDRMSIVRWEKQHPEFGEVIRTGRLTADAVVADRLYKRATGWEHEAVKIYLVDEVTTTKGPDGVEITTTVKKPLYVPYVERFPPDTTAAIFWLNNRQIDKWRRRFPHDPDSGTPPGDTFVQNNYDLTVLDADERALLREFLTRARAIPGPSRGDPSSAG